MNITDYLASGILADYCMGLLGVDKRLEVEQMALLHPIIKQELDANALALEHYATHFERQPKKDTKEKILGLLSNLEIEEDSRTDHFPLINKYSNHENWLKKITPLLPASTEEEIFVKVINDDPRVFQAILWLKSYFPDEVHTKVQESALVLTGQCTCLIGNTAVKLQAGSYLEIPFNTHHHIQVTSGPVLAIIQRLKVA